MRMAGATARTMLESAAASKWGVPASECHAKNHEVVHAETNRKLGFGELVSLAAQQPVPKKEDLKFKSPSEYRYIGKEVPIVDLDAITEGRATFGMDARMPGMVYASIERSPVIGGTLKNVDDAEARKVRGVSANRDHRSLHWALGISTTGWSGGDRRQYLGRHAGPPEAQSGLGSGRRTRDYDSAAYKNTLQETARKTCKPARNDGDVDAAFAKAAKTIEAEYYVPHLAHASMEPPVAVAEFKDGKVTCWTPTQNPQAVQTTVAQAVGIKPEDVTCHVTLLGGGFGRKSKPDYVAEAAVLSKQLGKPVKVVWSREDDIHFDYYHAVAAMYMKASVDEKGRPNAWLQRSVFPPIGSMNDASARYGTFELSLGWTDVPYEIPNFRAEVGPAEAQGPHRLDAIGGQHSARLRRAIVHR